MDTHSKGRNRLYKDAFLFVVQAKSFSKMSAAAHSCIKTESSVSGTVALPFTETGCIGLTQANKDTKINGKAPPINYLSMVLMNGTAS